MGGERPVIEGELNISTHYRDWFMGKEVLIWHDLFPVAGSGARTLQPHGELCAALWSTTQVLLKPCNHAQLTFGRGTRGHATSSVSMRAHQLVCLAEAEADGVEWLRFDRLVAGAGRVMERTWRQMPTEWMAFLCKPTAWRAMRADAYAAAGLQLRSTAELPRPRIVFLGSRPSDTTIKRDKRAIVNEEEVVQVRSVTFMLFVSYTATSLTAWRTSNHSPCALLHSSR